ncbi:MAG: alanine racemase [Alphaproteobacteria bacterium]|nr:alanine racemase [Alphaproteobacteria bacterium]
MKKSNVHLVANRPEEVLDNLPSHCLSAFRVNLDSIAHNFNFLQSRLPNSRCSAVVKADAYGLGMTQIAPTLIEAGCRDFFVATIDEALQLRRVIAEGHIYVLSGLLKGCEDELDHHQIIPVLNDLGQIHLWNQYARNREKTLPAVIHVDTGMWRLGLPPREVNALVADLSVLSPFDLKLIMSHLACSDSPHHDKNLQQLDAFNEARKRLPQVPASMANSHGIFLGDAYHYDMVRPGRSLYGLGARFLHTDGLCQALQIYAKVLQVSPIGKGETIGYDAMYCVSKPTRIATISIGYADGYVRTLSNHGRVFIQGYEAPIVGRVSMDVITVDVGEVPEHLAIPGAWAEIIGENISADEVALAAGTTSREISSKMGSRFHRIYT